MSVGQRHASDGEKHAGPGSLWPFPVDATLAFVNEPCKGGRGCNVTIEDGAGPREVHFAAAVDIAAGEELFVDYGLLYDRSSYGPAPDGDADL